MDKEVYNVSYVIIGEKKKGEIELVEFDDSVEILFKCDDISVKKQESNYFDALIEIRKILEENKIKLLCQGCAKDVYPSAMMLSMGMGRKAYKNTMGVQAKLNSTVDIFSPCTIEEYSTIEQQYHFFNEWAGSIGK